HRVAWCRHHRVSATHCTKVTPSRPQAHTDVRVVRNTHGPAHGRQRRRRGWGHEEARRDGGGGPARPHTVYHTVAATAAPTTPPTHHGAGGGWQTHMVMTANNH